MNIETAVVLGRMPASGLRILMMDIQVKKSEKQQSIELEEGFDLVTKRFACI
jgi:hypothetical protein